MNFQWRSRYILDNIRAYRLCVGLFSCRFSVATRRLHSVEVSFVFWQYCPLYLWFHTFSNPKEDQIFRIIDDYIDLNKMLYPQAEQRRLKSKANVIKSSALNRVLEPMRLSQVITACHQNQTIYNVLQLSNHFDITSIHDYPVRYGISMRLNELVANIQLESDIEILSQDAVDGIDKLAQSELKDFQGYKFLDNVSQSIRHSGQFFLFTN